jgi:phosphopantothenoylcysteine synthetase/decarboxylase
MGMLFNNWLRRTRDLQENVYFINYEEMEGDKPQNIRKLVEYMRWNMLAIDDELAEMRQAISWKPWQHDAPYADREEIVKEAVDVLHFVANIIVAAGGTDEMLDKFYIEKMERNKERQLKGYKVKEQGVKCELCTRALDDVGRSRNHGICIKCLPDEIGGDN